MQNYIFNNDGKELVLKKMVKISRTERKEKRISSIENPDRVFLVIENINSSLPNRT